MNSWVSESWKTNPILRRTPRQSCGSTAIPQTRTLPSPLSSPFRCRTNVSYRCHWRRIAPRFHPRPAGSRRLQCRGAVLIPVAQSCTSISGVISQEPSTATRSTIGAASQHRKQRVSDGEAARRQRQNRPVKPRASIARWISSGARVRAGEQHGQRARCGLKSQSRPRAAAAVRICCASSEITNRYRYRNWVTISRNRGTP